MGLHEMFSGGGGGGTRGGADEAVFGVRWVEGDAEEGGEGEEGVDVEGSV